MKELGGSEKMEDCQRVAGQELGPRNEQSVKEGGRRQTQKSFCVCLSAGNH